MSGVESFRGRLSEFLERNNVDRLMSGASAVAIFGLVVSLLVYSVYSWIDVWQLGLSQRDQVLHIAVPIFAALALAIISTNNFLQAFDLVAIPASASADAAEQ